MFTFSSGFEAATLKIPNKDSTAYGANPSATANAVSPAGRGSFQIGFPYANANDPYNMLSINQSGVVDGREGPGAWPTSDINDLAGGMNVNQPPSGAPRKQIIGFAKFRTRAEALAARDLLQGRRVDIEKGAILKAEMAKKNLHTKRGVGPLGAPLSVNVGGTNAPNNMHPGMGINNGGGLGGISESISNMTGLLSPTLGGPEALSARERELGTLGAMGLTSLSRRDLPEEDREMRRRRDYGSVSALATGLGNVNIHTTRGARERLEEDERERERRKKEKEAERTGRLRGGSQVTYDAFHSITIPQRQMGSILSPTESISAHPFATSQLFSPQESISSRSVDGWPMSASQTQNQRVGSIGSGLPPVRAVALGITTSTGSVQSSHEQSPTEVVVDSSRGGSSDHPISQESELLSPSGLPLSSQPSMSSLGSRSRPYSPPNEGFVSNTLVSKALEQTAQKSSQNPIQNGPPVSNSGSSSISGSRSSSSSSIDEEVSRTIGNIDVNSHQGTISPQLPSPNSGGSSGAGSRSNASDQNPPVCS